MSAVIDLFDVAFKTNAQVRKFTGVALSTAADYTVTQADSQSVGIAQRDAASGQNVPVMLHGVSRALTGIAVVRGNRVTTATSGFIVPVTSGAALPSPILGNALTSAASGMIAHVFINTSFTGQSGGAA